MILIIIIPSRIFFVLFYLPPYYNLYRSSILFHSIFPSWLLLHIFLLFFIFFRSLTILGYTCVERWVVIITSTIIVMILIFFYFSNPFSDRVLLILIIISITIAKPDIHRYSRMDSNGGCIYGA